MLTLFVRCENDWCALLHVSHTKLLYGTTTAPNPNLDSRSARAQVTRCEWVCFEREGEGSVGAKGGDFAPQSAHTQFSGSRWSLRSSASAFASDILRSASAVGSIWGRGELRSETPAHQLAGGKSF